MAEKKIQGRWSDDEHQRYLEGLKKFGENYKLIQQVVKSRSCQQIRTHHRTAQQKKLKGAVIAAALSASASSDIQSKKRKNEESEKSQPKKVKGDEKESSKESQSPPNLMSITEPTSKEEKTLQMPITSKQQPIPDSIPIQKEIVDGSKLTNDESLMPPVNLPSAVPTAPNVANTEKQPTKPEKLEPLSGTSGTLAIDEVQNSEMKSSGGLVEFLLREDVQACVAGIFGFAIVFIFKMIG